MIEPIEIRRERYERIRAMREQEPPMTYAAIGEVLGLTRSRVNAIDRGGPPRVNGRPLGSGTRAAESPRQTADTEASDDGS